MAVERTLAAASFQIVHAGREHQSHCLCTLFEEHAPIVTRSYGLGYA